MNELDIISKLPYAKPFLFVDRILNINADGVEGEYTFDANLDFYKGHLVGNPITPGVILTEVMAQIGVVCLGVFLLNENEIPINSVALTSTAIDFLKPVYPNEKVTVISRKIYFRFGKLKCEVSMKNHLGEIVCRGIISGMIV